MWLRRVPCQVQSQESSGEGGRSGDASSVIQNNHARKNHLRSTNQVMFWFQQFISPPGILPLATFPPLEQVGQLPGSA